MYLFYGWFLSVLLPVVSVLLGVGEGDGDTYDGGEHRDQWRKGKRKKS